MIQMIQIDTHSRVDQCTLEKNNHQRFCHSEHREESYKSSRQSV